MDALAQYIALYEQEHDLINSGSAGALNAHRAKALAALSSMELPAKGSENYEQTDLAEYLAPDYGLNLGRRDMGIETRLSFRCGVPELAPAMLFNRNDTFDVPAQSLESLPEGVEVMSLARAAVERKELVDEYYGRAAKLSNPIVALNTLLAQDGLFLRVKRGVKVAQPLQLVNIMRSAMPLMAVRRALIIVEPEAEAKLLVCSHSQTDTAALCSLEVTEVYAEQGSHFDLYDLEESGEHTRRLSAVYAELGTDSNVLIDGITLYNGATRNEYYARFRGAGAELRLLGMGIEDAERRLDTFSEIRHEAPACHTDELFKYVVDGRANGAFTGLIYVAPGAEKTEAYQSNRNLVGSAEARMFSKPQLEIYNDDVKCSHGSATGQLDELQLFYMRTRGIDESTARLLLKQAFMADVIDGVRLDALRERLTRLVERRFAGEAGSCAGCMSPCTADKK